MEEIIINLLALINVKYLLIYLLVINLIGFLAMGIDKFKAQRGYWRIPEATLMTLCLLGGGFGTIAGMYTFRHKTKKLKFSIGMPTILISEIAVVIYIVIRFVIMKWKVFNKLVLKNTIWYNYHELFYNVKGCRSGEMLCLKKYYSIC